MRSLKHLATTALVFGLALCGLDALAAGNMSGTMTAQMVLTAGCSISGSASTASTGMNFGTLDFGSHPSTFTGVLAANPSAGASGAGVTEIVCSPDVNALNVSVSGGNNAGQGGSVGIGSRALKNGSAYLPYEVYSDPSMVTAFPASASAVGVPLPSTGAPIALPVYGRINKTTANPMPAGTYVDVLQVTLSW